MQHRPESLAAATGVSVARVLGVKVGELFRPVGRTEQEKILLGVLEGEAL